MLRKVVNRLARRKETVHESINFSELQRLLPDLSKAIRISGRYSRPNSAFDVDRVKFGSLTWEEISEFLKEEFQPGPQVYCEGYHQVFSGQQDERHYIDLLKEETRIVGNQKLRKRIPALATLDYTLQKEE